MMGRRVGASAAERCIPGRPSSKAAGDRPEIITIRGLLSSEEIRRTKTMGTSGSARWDGAAPGRLPSRKIRSGRSASPAVLTHSISLTARAAGAASHARFLWRDSHEGIGGASRLLHRFEIASILPQAPHPRPPTRFIQLLG